MQEIILFLVGIVVGAMNAIAGGGMLVGFPVMIALGIHPLVANATANIVTGPGQLASAFGYRHYLRKVPLKYAWLLVPVTGGAAGGALLLRYTPPDHFAQMVPGLVFFGVVLFAFQPLLHFHLHRHLRGKYKTWLPIIFIGLATIPISIYGGYFGAGYGFMMLAFLGFTNLHDTHMINAMKNVAAIGVASASIVCLYGAHLIDWHVGAIAASGSAVGGYVGARYAQKVSSHQLRIIVITIGLLAVVYLAAQEY
jgi:uncharacterized membrane protein YfcA